MREDQTETPPLLYKFVSPKTAELVLGGLSVRHTPLPELNDAAETPFDKGAYDKLQAAALQCLIPSAEIPAEELEATVAMFAAGNLLATNDAIFKKYGALSLAGAQALSEHLMWAHYADSHTGIAIGFATSSKALEGSAGLHPVSYDLDSPFHLAEGFARRIYCKAPCWHYEAEYRSWRFVKRNLASQLSQFDATEVEEIVFGCRTSLALIDLVCAWKRDHGASTRLKQSVIMPDARLVPMGVSIPALLAMKRRLEVESDAFAAEIAALDEERIQHFWRA